MRYATIVFDASSYAEFSPFWRWIIFFALSALIVAGLYSVLLKRPPLPTLSAQLEIGDATWGSFRLMLENRDTAVSRVRLAHNSSSTRGYELMDIEPRDMQPHDKLSIPIRFYKATPQERGLRVSVAYEAKLRGAFVHCLASYGFMWGDNTPPGTVISPHSSQLEERPFDESRSREDTTEGFAGPEGTLALVLPELGEDGTPNVFQIGNPSRHFLFDMGSLTARFETMNLPQGPQGILGRISPGSSSNHLVILSWNSTGFALMLDGQEVKSPNFERPEK
jgi:hypothetical protein